MRWYSDELDQRFTIFKDFSASDLNKSIAVVGSRIGKRVAMRNSMRDRRWCDDAIFCFVCLPRLRHFSFSI